MTQTTVNVTLSTVTELRDLANRLEARIAADANDAAADYALRRTETEVRRRQRLCRAPHPAGHAICALLDGHAAAHRSLTERDTWAQ